MSVSSDFRAGRLTEMRRPNAREREKAHKDMAAEIFDAIDLSALAPENIVKLIESEAIKKVYTKIAGIERDDEITPDGKVRRVDVQKATRVEELGKNAAQLQGQFEKLIERHGGVTRRGPAPTEKIERAQKLLLEQAAAMPSGDGVMRLLEQQFERGDQEAEFCVSAILPVARTWLETTDRSAVVDQLPVTEVDPWVSLIEEAETFVSDHTVILNEMLAERIEEARKFGASVIEAIETEGLWEGSEIQRIVRHEPGGGGVVVPIAEPAAGMYQSDGVE